MAIAPEAPVEPVAEPAPVEVAVAPEAPVEPVVEPVAEPATIEIASAPDAPVEPISAIPTTTDPFTSEPVATIPDTTIIAALPTPDPVDPLGSTGADEPPPVRLAALTWQTRGIMELNAVDADRSRLTGNEVTPDNDANRQLLAAIDPSLLSDQNLTVDEGNLARTIQAELARLGCYRMTVDGSWGKGSRTALTSYFLARKLVPTSLEPSGELVSQLQRESKVVCAVQVARAKIVPGKTRAILPVKASVQRKDVPKNFKPKAGRVAKTTTERKKSIKKSLMGSGGF